MDDLISRQAVKEKLINNLTYMNLFGTARSITLIDEVPSADVAPVRHGTWIEDRYNNLDYVCSECGEPCANMVMGKPRDRYCKWCGARMGGEQNED